MKNYKRITNTNLDEFNPRYAFCMSKSLDYLCENSCDYQGCARKGGDCENYKQFVKMYNRLYELEDKIEDGTLVEWKHKKECLEEINKLNTQLFEISQKIEQGLLVELPVKIGDTVYSITPKCKWLGQCTEFDQHCCSRRSCDAFITEEKFTMYLFNRIGDDVVVTKEEAKAKLRGEL